MTEDMTEDKTYAVAVREAGAAAVIDAIPLIELPDRQTLARKLAAVRDFQQLVHAELIADHDYGVIPGTAKPTLLKPGAEKLAKLLDCQDHYDVLESVEDWDRPLFHYRIRCSLVRWGTSIVLSEGLGSCNSREKRFDGQDTFSVVNTVLKMARKRALVDAALSAGRLSNLFTQDLEEMPQVAPPAAPPKAPQRPPKAPERPADGGGSVGSREAGAGGGDDMIAPLCGCGMAMIEKAGVNAKGKPWRGWFCVNTDPRSQPPGTPCAVKWING